MNDLKERASLQVMHLAGCGQPEAAAIMSLCRSRIEQLEACLADTRDEICLGPVDDTLWHTEIPACTSVDNITLTLGDDWSYDDWLQDQRTQREQSDE